MADDAAAEAVTPPPAPPPRGWSAEEWSLVGAVPDAEVARRTGRKVDSVKHARARHGIPPAGQGSIVPMGPPELDAARWRMALELGLVNVEAIDAELARGREGGA